MKTVVALSEYKEKRETHAQQKLLAEPEVVDTMDSC